MLACHLSPPLPSSERLGVVTVLGRGGFLDTSELHKALAWLGFGLTSQAGPRTREVRDRTVRRAQRAAVVGENMPEFVQ